MSAESDKTAVAGVVVDRLGNPAPKVLVKAVSQRVPDARPPSCVTEIDGRFEIGGLAPDTYALELRPVSFYEGPSYRVATVTLAPGQRADDLRLVFDGAEGLTISGKVTNVRHEPLAGALINAHMVAGSVSHGDATTGPDGRYVIAGLAPGPHWINLHHPEHGSIDPVEVEAGSRNVDFVLGSRPVIEGRVLDKRTGAPIVEFEISVSSMLHHRVSPALRSSFKPHQDPEGRFQHEMHRPGDATVVARAQGYAPALVQVLDLQGGETRTGIEFRLESDGVVIGKVTDDAGDPVADAEIHFGMPLDDRFRRQSLAATSAGDGTFRLESLEGGTLHVTVLHPDYAPATVAVDVQLGGTVEVNVVLGQGGVLEGIISCDGEPAPGQHVSVLYLATGAHGGTGRTDNTGFYRITKLAPGLAAIRASAHEIGGIQFHQMSVRAQIESGSTTHVDFPFTTGSASIAGVVTVDGQPPAETRIMVRQIRGDSACWSGRFTGRADGAYALENLPAGLLHLMISAQDARGAHYVRNRQVEVAEGAVAHLDVELTAGGRVVGQVLGAVPRRTMLRLYRGRLGSFNIGARTGGWHPGAFLRHGFVRPDGTYEFAGLEPGVYTIFAVCEESQPDMSDARTAVGHVELNADEELQFDLTLE